MKSPEINPNLGQNKHSSEIEFTEARNFLFNKNEIDETKVSVLDVGNLDSIFKRFQNGESNETSPKMMEIIKLLSNYKTTLPNGIKKNAHVLITGGFVRDILLNHRPKDVDFATNLTSDEIISCLQPALKDIKQIQKQGENFSVVRVTFNGEPKPNGDGFYSGEDYEIATLRSGEESEKDISSTNKPYDDAQSRDLTLNGLFYNPNTGHIVDYVGGIDDIKNKKLRFVGNPISRIKEDRIRMMRFVRFVFKTGFSPEEKSVSTIKENGHLLTERTEDRGRIKSELDKIMDLASAISFIEELERFDLLKTLIPELEESEVESNFQDKKDDALLTRTKEICINLPTDASSPLKWAAILTTICEKELKNTKASENSNDKKSKDKKYPANQVFARLGFPKTEIREITWLIDKNRELKDLLSKDASLIKGFMKSVIAEYGNSLVNDLIRLHQASNHESEKMPALIEMYDLAKKEISQELELDIDLKKMVSGKLIMEIKGLAGGEIVGKIKKEVKDILFDEFFEDKEDAEKRIIETIKSIHLP